MGGVLFVYDTGRFGYQSLYRLYCPLNVSNAYIVLGIVSGAILQLRGRFRLSCIQQEMVVSSMLMGALLASFTGGKLPIN